MSNQRLKILNKYNTEINDHSSYHIITIIHSVIFKIVGLSPWTNGLLNFHHNHHFSMKNYSIQYSICGTVYNIALISATCLYLVWSFDDLIPRKNQSLLTTTVGENIHILGIITTISIWLFYVLRQKMMINIVNKLIYVNSMLQRCELYKFRNNNIIHWILVGNLLMSMLLVIVGFIVYSPILFPIRFIPALINCWILMQYALLLDVVIKQFESIYSTILKLGDIDTSIKLQTLFVTKVPLRRHIIYDMNNIRNAHEKLFKICGQISNFYGLPILVTIGYFGASSISYGYFIILSFFLEFQDEILVNYLSFSVWFLMMMYGFFVMTTNVARTVAQSERTASAIHLLLDRCTVNEKIYENLVEFSWDILHQKMEFGAFGIISFDGSLLQMMGGTIVTYLVILIQFRLN